VEELEVSRGRKPKPNLVRIICAARSHWDEPKFKRNGFHLVELMELLPMADGGYTLNRLGLSPAMKAPVKRHPSPFVYVFYCTCERNLQLQEPKLMPRVLARYEAAGVAPGAARIDLDITTL
jgi:hypothetical protein